MSGSEPKKDMPKRWRDFDGDLIPFKVTLGSGQALIATVDDTPHQDSLRWRDGEHGGVIITEPVINWEPSIQ